MNTARIIGLIVLIGTVLALTASARTREADNRSETAPAHPQAQGMMGMMGGASMHQQGMQSGMHDGAMGGMSHQQMMQGLQEQDTQLQQLVARMNAATGPARMDAIAKVVTELANRQSAMRHGMMDVQPQMMQDMMEHMNGGTMSGMSSMMNGGTNGHMRQQAGSSR